MMTDGGAASLSPMPPEGGPAATVGEGVRRLGTEWVNWYLIEDGPALTVVDAGLPGHWDRFEETLAGLGRRVEDVAALVLTHNHTDHLGVAATLHARAGARVLVHEADAAIVRGDAKPKPIPGFIASLPHRSFLGYLAHVVRNGGAKRPGTVAAVETFGDGDTLDVPGRPRVLYTPGHSPGHCALLLEERGVLFSGDALVTLNLRTGARGPTVLPINQDRDDAVRSLERFDGVEAGALLPGHGDPWTGGVAEALRQARSRLPS